MVTPCYHSTWACTAWQLTTVKPTSLSWGTSSAHGSAYTKNTIWRWVAASPADTVTGNWLSDRQLTQWQVTDTVTGDWHGDRWPTWWQVTNMVTGSQHSDRQQTQWQTSVPCSSAQLGSCGFPQMHAMCRVPVIRPSLEGTLGKHRAVAKCHQDKIIMMLFSSKISRLW